jgi:hypothetical protein
MDGFAQFEKDEFAFSELLKPFFQEGASIRWKVIRFACNFYVTFNIFHREEVWH